MCGIYKKALMSESKFSPGCDFDEFIMYSKRDALTYIQKKIPFCVSLVVNHDQGLGNL